MKAFEGVPEFQYILGEHYETGSIVRRDDCAAVLWYKEAASNGHADANFRLGFMHFNGFGVPVDKGRAGRHFRRASSLGHREARYWLRRFS